VRVARRDVDASRNKGFTFQRVAWLVETAYLLCVAADARSRTYMAEIYVLEIKNVLCNNV
jgi:hypothetical protein